MNIYKITNLNNNKVYVGQTKRNIENRFNDHKKRAKEKVNRYLYDSMNHHGYDSFVVELLEVCEEKIANEREKYWIAKFGCLHPDGYNMTVGGGGGNTLRSWSEEDRNKLYYRQGQSRKGKRPERWVDNIRKASKIREANKTPEQKLIISEKIRQTNIKKGIKPPLTSFCGKDHWGWVEVTKEDLIECVKAGMKIKEVAEKFGCRKATIWTKIKLNFGEDYDYFRLRREYRSNKSN